MNTLKNTTLSVGLLNTPVKLMNATSKMGDIHFSTVGPDGQPVERVYRDKETEEVITHDELRKAYQGQQIDPTELANIEEACTKDEDGNDLTLIHVDFFMPLKDVPMERAEDLYYIAPNAKLASPESLLHFMAGLKKRKVAAIAKIVIKSRQKLLVIFPDGDHLKAVSLRFEEAIVSPDSGVTIEGKVQKPVLDMMNTLIDATMGSVDDLKAIEDTFVVHKRELVDRLVTSGQAPVKAKTAKKVEKPASGLLEALEASVKVAKKGRVAA